MQQMGVAVQEAVHVLGQQVQHVGQAAVLCQNLHFLREACAQLLKRLQSLDGKGAG